MPPRLPLQTGSCCKNIFWNSSINEYIKSMAVPLAYVGSLVQTPSWRIPQEVTTTRTICLIDAVKSENCYDMKLPIQIGWKLWLTQYLLDNNVIWGRGVGKGTGTHEAIPNYSKLLVSFEMLYSITVHALKWHIIPLSSEINLF